MTTSIRVDPVQPTVATMFSIIASGLDRKLWHKTLLDGQGGSTKFKPDRNGYIDVGSPFPARSTPGTQVVRVQALISGIWTDVVPPLTITVVAAAPAPVPSPTPAPAWPTIPDAPAPWIEVLNATFPTDVPEGDFTNNGNPAYPWLNPYDLGWKQTDNWRSHGIYNPGLGSVRSALLRMGARVINGVPNTFTFGTFPPGCSTRGGYLGFRFEVVMRSSGALGSKIAFMGWTDAPSDPVYGPDYPKWRDGEIDWCELDLDGSFIAAYLHYANVKVSVDSSGHVTPLESPYQDAWQSSTTKLDAWHRIGVEWVPGKYVDILVDGIVVKHFTTRIPTVPFHVNLQLETNLHGAPVDPAGGEVQIAQIRQWRLS